MNIALKELLRRPGRFVPVGGALTMLVLLLVVLGGFLDGLELNQTGPYRAHEDRLLVFSADSELLIQRSRVAQDTAGQLVNVTGVASVGTLNVVASTAADDNDEILDIVLFGYQLPTDVLPEPPSDGGAVIDSALAERNDVSVGDTLRLGSSSEPVVVRQIVEDLSQGDPTVWLSAQRWREIVQAGNPTELPPDGTDEALVIEPTSETTLDALAATLRDTPGALDGIVAVSAEEAIEALPVVQQQSSTFRGIILVTFIVTLLVVALFFALITLERVDLYAVLKAMGARTGTLMAGISAQAIGVSLAALALGVGLSLLFVGLLPADLPVRIVPSRLLQISVGILATALLGSLFTLRRVLRIDPAEAIG